MRTSVAAAAEEVKKNAGALREAPLTEIPVVAALQALHLARTALGTLTSVVASQTGALTSTVMDTVHAGRDRAAAAVTSATQELTHAQEQISSGVAGGARGLARRAADAGVDLAIRQAANIDSRMGLTDKVRIDQ